MENETNVTDRTAQVIAWVQSWPVEVSEAEDGTVDFVVTVTPAPWTEPQPDENGDLIEHLKATYNVPAPWSLWLATGKETQEQTLSNMRQQTYSEVIYPALTGDFEASDEG